MNRLDADATLHRETPAVALGWPETLVSKLDRVLKRKPGSKVRLTEEEHAVVIGFTGVNPDPDYKTEWFNHRNKQVVVSCVRPAIWRL